MVGARAVAEGGEMEVEHPIDHLEAEVVEEEEAPLKGGGHVTPARL